MVKLRFTREDSARVIKQIKENRPKYIYVATNGREFRLVSDHKTANILYKEPIVRVSNKLGWGISTSVGRDEDIYAQLTGEHYKQLEDDIYTTINSMVRAINQFGFLASAMLIRQYQYLVDQITEVANKNYQDISYEGVSDEVLDAYKKEHDPWFSNAIEVDRANKVLKVKAKRSFKDHIVKIKLDGSISNGVGLFIKDIVGSLARVVKNYDEAIVVMIKKHSKLGNDEIFKGLSTISNHVADLSRNYTVNLTHIERLREFNSKYNRRVIEWIKPVVDKGRPHVLVKGDLSKFRYETGSYIMGFDRKSGVRKVEDNTYLLTMNAFSELEGAEGYDNRDDSFFKQLETADFLEGDWSQLFYVNDRYYKTVNKNLVKAIDSAINKNLGFRHYIFNSGKEGASLFGFKNILFYKDFLGEDNGYSLGKDDDDYKELLESIALVDTDSLFAREYRDFVVGYERRSRSYDEELAQKYIDDANKLEEIYGRIKDEFLDKIKPALKARYGYEINTFDEFVQLDGKFGLDSGFVFVEYVDAKVQQEAKDFRDLYDDEVRNGGVFSVKYKYPDQAAIYPNVQSVVIKGNVARYVVSEFNKTSERKLKVREVLD